MNALHNQFLEYGRFMSFMFSLVGFMRFFLDRTALQPWSIEGLFVVTIYILVVLWQAQSLKGSLTLVSGL